MKDYQLVVAFAADTLEDFERVTDFQLRFSDKLQYGDIDGNDVGGGVVNLFIITKNPEKCFGEVMGHLKLQKLNPFAAGYRSLDKDDYIRLWPTDDNTPFKLM